MLLMLGISVLILNLLGLSQVKLQFSEINKLLLEVLLNLAIVAYLFLANYMGQTIMNSSEKLLNDA
ncbi:uncharacterized protein LOC113464249 [Ceratina calcarata]|uniref:Uncharacterized protein LOC113464249 n=1 Tax=Ceratina calcarata TaxID=156304 RepID=A0AAJ7S000_9HYME|nr:uncharacterized protein LOC113464249 [Ceratina calcarata]